jgi:hypothetical protein
MDLDRSQNNHLKSSIALSLVNINFSIRIGKDWPLDEKKLVTQLGTLNLYAKYVL